MSSAFAASAFEVFMLVVFAFSVPCAKLEFPACLPAFDADDVVQFCRCFCCSGWHDF